MIPRIALSLILVATFASAVAQSTFEPTMDQLQRFRVALSGYEDVDRALEDGYAQFGSCMSGPQGGQGIHFTNDALIGDTASDPARPDVLMYEPRADGTLRLVGAEYLIFQQAWHDAGNAPAPAFMGREFVLNTTLLSEPFYALHVWGWHHNPAGIFANWNPLVTCEHEVVGAAAHDH